MKSSYLLIIFFVVWSSPVIAMENRGAEQAILAIKEGHYSGIDSLLIYENNDLVTEHYFNGFNKARLHQTRSTFKSITGLLAAIAIDKNILDVNEKVLPLISRFDTAAQNNMNKTELTIAHLLNMTSGFACSEMPGTGPYHDDAVDNGAEPLKYSLSIAMGNQPGMSWKYCNANSFLLGVAISAALERAKMPNIREFARVYLFAPLDIKEYQTYQSPDGFLYAQGNARFTPRDLAKFGMLILNRGQWQGRRIIAEQHIDAIQNGIVTTDWSWTNHLNSQLTSNAKYAYQWYRSEFKLKHSIVPVSHTWGNGGQFIFVIPSSKRVIVFTGSNYGDIDKQKQAFEILYKYLM